MKTQTATGIENTKHARIAFDAIAAEATPVTDELRLATWAMLRILWPNCYAGFAVLREIGSILLG